MSKKIKEELSKMKTEDIKSLFDTILEERKYEMTSEGRKRLVDKLNSSLENKLEESEYYIAITGNEEGEDVYVDFENVEMDDNVFMGIISRLVLSSLEEVPTKEEDILAWSGQMSALLFNKLIGGLLHGDSTSK